MAHMQRNEIEAAFIKTGLARRLASIEILARDAIRLLARPVHEKLLPLGASKLGGSPDLPARSAWPTFRGQPQAFLAQIQLADVALYDTRGLLPRQGMLWFFYDADQETFGDTPQNRGGWRILFSIRQPTSLKRQPAPQTLPETSLFRTCALTARRELTLAQQPELELPDFDWSDNEQQAYERALELLRRPEELAQPRHRMLGYPDTIQDDMRLQCQLISHGITNIDDPRVASLRKGAADWLLLLQIDSDAGARMNWSNNGMLYYWITQDDLQARRFEQSWLVLQAE